MKSEIGDLIESRHRFGYRLRAIPKIGLSYRRAMRRVAFLLVSLLGAQIAAADDPKFDYGKQDEVKDVKGIDWTRRRRGRAHPDDR